MDKYKIVLYALHGAWNTPDYDGVTVLKVADDVDNLKKILEAIASSHASDYIPDALCDFSEERGERHYEVSDDNGVWAKFYITEHYVELSESLMGAISRKMGEIDRIRDVGAHLQNLYKGSNIEAWKYEYMTRKPEVIREILQLFDKMEDCNTPFNVTMELAAEKVIGELALDDAKLEFLWEEFGDVLIDDDECILDDFLGFEYGTHREEVWHWFDERYSGGVAALMFGVDEDGRN